MRLSVVLASALVSLVPASVAFAQAVPQAEPPTVQVEDVEVVGARNIEERAAAFVEGVGAPPRGQKLARWDRELCIGVGNMPREAAQRMIDRIAMIASALGLSVGAPGCRATVLVIATPEPDDLAAGMVREDPDQFRPAQGNTDLGPRALQRFRASDAPVRWWQVSMPVSADSGQIAVRLNHDDDAPTIATHNTSRLRSGVRNDLSTVLVIVDTHKLGNSTFTALSDYVGMLALAQIDPDADVSAYPTVLNLFEERATVTGLTDWDWDYLKALYGARRDFGYPSGQVAQIAASLADAQRTTSQVH